MTMPLPWPDPDDLAQMPVEAVAMHILWRLVDEASARAHSRQRFINHEALAAYTSGSVQSRSENALAANPDLARALAEAWDWLAMNGILSTDPLVLGRPGVVSADAWFVTRRGLVIAKAGTDGLELIRARRRLGVELHPRLAGRLRPLVSVGAFEQAAFDALREVEVVVVELAGLLRNPKGRALTGTALMQEALKPAGPLADPDPDADEGEQVGIMQLFAGAFSAFRNPLGHRQIRWTDPTEAAEVVLLADLLMRHLDNVAIRLGKSI